MNAQSTCWPPPASLAIPYSAAQSLAPGHQVVIEAEILGGEPEHVFAVIKYRREGIHEWSEVPMHFSADRHWQGQFPAEPGFYYYKIEAWVDGFKSWCHGLRQDLAAGRNIPDEVIQAGVPLIEAVKHHATALDAERLQGWAAELRSGNSATGAPLILRALDGSLSDLMARLAAHQPGRRLTVTSEKELRIRAAMP